MLFSSCLHPPRCYNHTICVRVSLDAHFKCMSHSYGGERGWRRKRTCDACFSWAAHRFSSLSKRLPLVVPLEGGECFSAALQVEVNRVTDTFKTRTYEWYWVVRGATLRSFLSQTVFIQFVSFCIIFLILQHRKTSKESAVSYFLFCPFTFHFNHLWQISSS